MVGQLGHRGRRLISSPQRAQAGRPGCNRWTPTLVEENIDLPPIRSIRPGAAAFIRNMNEPGAGRALKKFAAQ